VILAQINHFFVSPAPLGFFQEGQTVGFSPIDLWNNMGWLARGVVFVLFIMSIWSLAVMIDR
jgi:biopolymer transport protein ExbB/TolQ